MDKNPLIKESREKISILRCELLNEMDTYNRLIAEYCSLCFVKKSKLRCKECNDGMNYSERYKLKF
tara:strand:+ start:277 stop:474 length:198 start_codon:yes stop_codon:yes gene_type:complete